MIAGMTPKQLKALIARGEGERLEFKQSLRQPKEIVRSLVAMANARGGKLLVGVRDDGEIVGVTVGNDTVANLVERDIKPHTSPKLLPSIDEVIVNGKTVLVLTVKRGLPGTVYRADEIAYLRSGPTNQVMPEEDQTRKSMASFKAELSARQNPISGGRGHWAQREKARVQRYEQNHGLFLIHRWQPSTIPGQVADVQIELTQHGEGPLTSGTVRNVRYHLGPKFATRAIVKRNARQRFRVNLSAYGPFLCTAVVNFTDGSAPVELERYIDFG